MAERLELPRAWRGRGQLSYQAKFTEALYVVLLAGRFDEVTDRGGQAVGAAMAAPPPSENDVALDDPATDDEAEPEKHPTSVVPAPR